MGGRRTTAARSTRTGCGKSLRASCRGPRIPKRRRRSAAPVNGGREKARPQGLHGRSSARSLAAVPRSKDTDREPK